jgi:hypothetical protein
MIDPTVAAIATRIETAREQSEKTFLSSAELVEMCSKKELDELVSAQEAALILSAMAGRNISADYVKLLRLRGRLNAARQVSQRAYLFRLRDVFFVVFNEKHNKKKISDNEIIAT